MEQGIVLGLHEINIIRSVVKISMVFITNTKKKPKFKYKLNVIFEGYM